jgi:hypothetical protein
MSTKKMKTPKTFQTKQVPFGSQKTVVAIRTKKGSEQLRKWVNGEPDYR